MPYVPHARPGAISGEKCQRAEDVDQRPGRAAVLPKASGPQAYRGQSTPHERPTWGAQHAGSGQQQRGARPVRVHLSGATEAAGWVGAQPSSEQRG